MIPELPDAADEPAAFCARLGHAIATALATLTATPTSDRLTTRTTRHRRPGDLVI